MLFRKKTWQDRTVEFPGRRNLTDVVTGQTKTYDVTRNEGNVAQAGDQFSGENMNGLENRIETAFEGYNSPRAVLIPAVGWSTTFPYVNTVNVDGATSGSNFSIVGVYAPSGANLNQVKAWNKAAAMLMTNSDDNAVGNGYIIFKAYKRPTTDFTVLIKGG